MVRRMSILVTPQTSASETYLKSRDKRANWGLLPPGSLAHSACVPQNKPRTMRTFVRPPTLLALAATVVLGAAGACGTQGSDGTDGSAGEDGGAIAFGEAGPTLNSACVKSTAEGEVVPVDLVV